MNASRKRTKGFWLPVTRSFCFPHKGFWLPVTRAFCFPHKLKQSQGEKDMSISSKTCNISDCQRPLMTRHVNRNPIRQ